MTPAKAGGVALPRPDCAVSLLDLVRIGTGMTREVALRKKLGPQRTLNRIPEQPPQQHNTNQVPHSMVSMVHPER